MELSELPPPPPDKCGWPWTEKPKRSRGNKSGSPRISIITPSFNQGAFIEETVRSVLLQDYPNFEYIVVDGGSTDNTLEILQKYQAWLTHWESRPDLGQAHAINKGLARATGEIVTWINSDDWYMPGALNSFGRAAARGWVVAACDLRTHDGALVKTFPPCCPSRKSEWMTLFAGCKTADVAQPSVAWRRTGKCSDFKLREDLHYVFDHELFAKLLDAFGPPELLPETVSNYRLHDASKTVAHQIGFARERLQLARHYASAEADEWTAMRIRVLCTLSGSRIRLHEAIKSGVCNPTSTRSLIAFSIKEPLVWSSRFFVGALRNALIRHNH